MQSLSNPSHRLMPASGEILNLSARYEKYLAEVRGVVCPLPQVRTSQCFLAFLEAMGVPAANVGKREIDRFITEQGGFYQKRTVASIASFLRAFLRYLTSEGIIGRDVSVFVQRPTIIQGERDPRYLKSHQVAKVLETPNGSTVVGLRDRAMLTLLAVYGLRACEVAPIRLEDIRWKAKILCIRHRKCGDTLELPLLPTAANALAEYLGVRPPSERREVFLTKYRPHKPIRYSVVTGVAQLAIRRAGLEVSRPGAHTFRYSHAQALFHTGQPLPEIAAALGHTDLRTTLGYLQITVHPLRGVALSDGEDLA